MFSCYQFTQSKNDFSHQSFYNTTQQHNTHYDLNVLLVVFLPGKSTIENELCSPSRSDNKNICKFTFKTMAECS